jgi:hypothetical protein
MRFVSKLLLLLALCSVNSIAFAEKFPENLFKSYTAQCEKGCIGEIPPGSSETARLTKYCKLYCDCGIKEFEKHYTQNEFIANMMDLGDDSRPLKPEFEKTLNNVVSTCVAQARKQVGL